MDISLYQPYSLNYVYICPLLSGSTIWKENIENMCVAGHFIFIFPEITVKNIFAIPVPSPEFAIDGRWVGSPTPLFIANSYWSVCTKPMGISLTCIKKLQNLPYISVEFSHQHRFSWELTIDQLVENKIGINFDYVSWKKKCFSNPVCKNVGIELGHQHPFFIYIHTINQFVEMIELVPAKKLYQWLQSLRRNFQQRGVR